MRWRDAEHKAFFEYIIHDLEGAEGPYTRIIVALLAACPVTREHFWEVYDNHSHMIRPGCWSASWNTTESRLVIGIAAVLSGDLLAPAAANGTLTTPILDAMVWADKIDAAVYGGPFKPL